MTEDSPEKDLTFVLSFLQPGFDEGAETVRVRKYNPYKTLDRGIAHPEGSKRTPPRRGNSGVRPSGSTSLGTRLGNVFSDTVKSLIRKRKKKQQQTNEQTTEPTGRDQNGGLQLSDEERRPGRRRRARHQPARTPTQKTSRVPQTHPSSDK